MHATSYFVYILKTGAGLYYTGVTKDVQARLAQHRAGRGAKFTKGRGPLTLVYVEKVGHLKSAMRREREIKDFSRQKKETLIQEFVTKKDTRHPTMKHAQRMKKRVAIIGAGPAGIAAAIQLKRAGIEPVVFEKGNIGGLLNNALWVENYPGFPDRITGPDLIRKFKQQLELHRIAVIRGTANSLRRRNDCIELGHGGRIRKYQCAIVASGTEPKALDLPEFGRRTFSEIYSIRNVRNKRIAIVGGGDAAFDYALNLSLKNQVTILMRDLRPRALPLLVKRARATNRISVYTKACVESIRHLHNCAIVQLSNGSKGRQELEFDYVVTAIGRRPALGFLSASLRRTYPRGIPGLLYFAGDVRAGRFRQTAIAVGDGIKVAMQIANHFQEDQG